MKPRFIIFLDIDGVFNCELHYNSLEFKNYKETKKFYNKKIERLEYYKSQISLERVIWYNNLVEDLSEVYEVQTIISSTHRSGKEIEELQGIFNYCGGTFKVFGKTGSCPSRVRGVEIKQWLEEFINQERDYCSYFDFYRYVIIDDDSDMLLNQANHFFQTDTYSGLTPTTCFKIKRFALHKTF